MSRQARTGVRWTAAFAAAVLAASLVLAPSPAAAQTPSDLDQARIRVAELEGRIIAGQNEVTALKNRLNALAAQVGRESAALGSIRVELGATTAKLDETKARLQQLRDRMRQRARTVYMRGPTQLFELVLGSKSFTELTGRIVYAAALARQDAKLVQLVRKAEAELTAQRDKQAQLESEQRSQVAAVSAQMRAVRSTFARQVAVAADLARQRVEALRLVRELEALLGSELAGLRRVAGQGMTISYGEWAASFLGALGAPASRNNMVTVVAWEASEGTQATWNPLATTKDMPGATTFNSHGVKNYRSKEQGIEATILTLRLPNRGYEPIVARLRASAEPIGTAEAIRDSRWCAGCAGGQYVVGIIAAVEEDYERYAG